MVTSSLGSSFSRAQEVVKEAVPPSVSHRDPKLSPTVNGLSLYLKHPVQLINEDVSKEYNEIGSTHLNRSRYKRKQVSCVLWGSRGETWLIKHVQFGSRGGLCSDGSFLLDHLHL